MCVCLCARISWWEFWRLLLVCSNLHLLLNTHSTRERRMHNSPQHRSVVSLAASTTHGDNHTHTHTRHTCWINWSVINQLVLPLLTRLRYSLYDIRNEYDYMTKCSWFNYIGRWWWWWWWRARCERLKRHTSTGCCCFALSFESIAAPLRCCLALRCLVPPRFVAVRCDAVVAAAAASSRR